MKSHRFLWIFAMLLIIAAPFAASLSISNVRVNSTTSTSITLQWDTDVASTSLINFGTTPALGGRQESTSLVTKHTIAFFGLSPDTLYYYDVSSQTSSGEFALDDNAGSKYSVKTRDPTPPAKVTGVSYELEGFSLAHLSWDASPESDLSHYSVYVNNALLSNTTQTTYTLRNLSIGASYLVRVAASDVSGNLGVRSDTLTIAIPRSDSTTPVISRLDVTNVTDFSAIVSWTTNEDASSRVVYGDPALTATGPISKLHSVELTNLMRTVAYNVSVQSCDLFGNCANASIDFIAGADIDEPTINITIPSHHNRRTITLTGTTEPFSQVELYVNDMAIPKRILFSEQTGQRGLVQFRSVALSDVNFVRILSIDRSGNRAISEGHITVDTIEPIVVYSHFPNITANKNATIKGSVSEPSTLRAYALLPKDKEEPTTNVSNFRNVSIGNGFIAIAWNEVRDRDFSHYILRRDGIPIATINPASYTFYTDILVDGGKQYSYTISYVNVFGTESVRSGPLALTAQGPILGIDPIPADLSSEFRKPLLEENVSGDFTLALPLTAGDGDYRLKIEVLDFAGNKIVREALIALDTKPPELRITTPPNGGLVYENHANDVDIIGETDPFATVHLYVGRTPFNNRNLSFDIAGLKRDIVDLPESSLSANCNAVIRTANICGTNADKSAVADKDGKFTFKNVDLRSLAAIGGGIKEVSNEDFNDEFISRESKTARLLLISTDPAGQRSVVEAGIRIGTCWSGNMTFEPIPLTEYQKPTFLTTERLAENEEELRFVFNYEYVGSGVRPKITNVNVLSACGSLEKSDPRFNLSCRLMPSSGTTRVTSDESKITTSGASAASTSSSTSSSTKVNSASVTVMNLNRLPEMDRWLKADWKGFTDAIGDEVVFPLRITLRYEHYVNGKKQTGTQSICQEVAYNIDKSRIDPRSVLPDFLLYDMVDAINKTILPAITSVQKTVDKAISFVGPLCWGSVVGSFGTVASRRIQERSVELQLRLALDPQSPGQFILGKTLPFPPQETEYCKALVRSFFGSAAYGMKFRMDYLSDADFKKCFPTLKAAWETEESVYKMQRYACDRIFGHTSPSRWTETATDDELVQKLKQGAQCGEDESVEGQPLRKVKCKDAIKDFNVRNPNEYQFIRDNSDCVERFGSNDKGVSSRSLYQITNRGTGNVVALTQQIGDFRQEMTYAIQVDDDNLLTSRSQDCAQVCGQTNSPARSATINGGIVTLEAPNSGASNTYSACMTSQQCTTINAQAQRSTRGLELSAPNPQQPSGSLTQIRLSNGDPFMVQRADRRGYTEDCFYNPDSPNQLLTDVSSVSDNPATRMECCCLRATKSDETLFYEVGDTYLRTGTTPEILSSSPIHEANTQVNTQASAQTSTTAASQGHTPLKWSYRYWKTGFRSQAAGTSTIHKAYHPQRYIEGRDYPACFGQNSWMDSAIGERLVMDPSRQWDSALQCANLGAIQYRLTDISNKLRAMQECGVAIRTTGKYDVGVCKEIFTTYMCSFIWDLIQGISTKFSGCSGSGISGFTNDAPDSNFAYLGNAVGGISDALSDKQSELSSEYLNAKINTMFGIGEDSVAKKICLGAFGSDWELSPKAFIDAAYSQSFATSVTPLTATREFLGVDPITGKSEYEYRASWMMTPGCDISGYDVSLVCIGADSLATKGNDLGLPSTVAANGADCTAQSSPDGVNCPCLYAKEQSLQFKTSGTQTKQGQLINDNHHKVISDRYRYDHLKFKVRLDARTYGRNTPLANKCFPDGFENGEFYYPITDRSPQDLGVCRIDATSGLFLCTTGVNIGAEEGFAYYEDLRINGNDIANELELTAGAPLKVTGTIVKSGGDKCVRISTQKSRYPDWVSPLFTESTDLDATITNELTLTGNNERIRVTDWITAIPEGELGNTNVINIAVLFIDANNDHNIDTDEKISIDGHEFKEGTPEIYSTSQSSIDFKSSSDILITKGGVSIRITSMNPSIVETFNEPTAEGTRIGTNIQIQPEPQGIQQQAIDITFGIYNLKKGVESFTSVADCNFNDPAESFEGEKQKTTISGYIRSSDFILDSNPVTVSITQPEGSTTLYPSQLNRPVLVRVSVGTPNQDISITGVNLVLKKPDNTASQTLPMTLAPQGTQANSQGTPLQWYGVEIPSSTFNLAGNYRLTAEASFQKPSAGGTTPTTGKKPSSEVVLNIGCAENAQCRPQSNTNFNPASGTIPCPQTPRVQVCTTLR